MPHRPRLLDLFCCAGGATRGYQLAGFHVVGVDIEPQPDYCGDEFIQDDALEFPLDGFDAIHASPPCQSFTAYRRKGHGVGDGYPDLIKPVRARLEQSGVPWVIENVAGAPLRNAVMLCGSSFGLDVRRHRYFESNVLGLYGTHCLHQRQGRPVGVYGDHPQDDSDYRRPDGTRRGQKARTITEAQTALGIDWMTTWDDLADAIPPAYTEHIGRQLIEHIERGADPEGLTA